MSFAGNLQDFSVLEVLRYVRLSNKTGVLKFSNGKETAEVSYQAGRITRAASSSVINIGDRLQEMYHISQEILVHALELQKQETEKRPLGMILSDLGVVSKTQVREAVVEQIENVIGSLCKWRKGTFEFELLDATGVDGFSVNFGDLLLPEEIDTEYLLREAIHRFGENGEKIEESDEINSPERVGAIPYLQDAHIPVLFLLNECLRLNEWVKDAPDCCLQPISCSAKSDIFRILSKLKETQTPSIVVYPVEKDGGVTEVEALSCALRENDFETRVLIVTFNADIETTLTLHGMGMDRILPFDKGASNRQSVEMFKVALLSDLKKVGAEIQNKNERKSTGLSEISQLKTMFLDVGKMEQSQTVSVEFLKIAASHFSRAILFLVGEGMLRGIGGYGSTSSDKKLSDLSQELCLSFSPDSLIGKCVETNSSYCGQTPSEPWLIELFDLIGGRLGQPITLLPVAGVERVFCLVYGDNQGKEMPCGSVELLELAAGQMGVILENAFLRKSLRKRKTTGASLGENHAD